MLIIPDALVLVENIGVYIMQAKNLHKVKAINTLFGAILNLIISIPLAKKFGSIGAAMGTALTLIIVSMIINNKYYYKKVKLDVIKFWKNVLRITIPLVPIFVITFLINRYVFLANSILTIILSAIIYSLLYSSISYCLCFNNYEKGIVKNIFKKVIKR